MTLPALAACLSAGLWQLNRGEEKKQLFQTFDNTAAREDLGFRVTIPWVEGARRTVKWLEENGMLEKSEDFPVYDRIIEAWRQATGKLNRIVS